MRLLNLKLRGAIGIRKGIGREEVEIDFSRFNPGLIALTGRNGSGKTTVMENLHPYRTMVSREGSLQSHFFLKDSYRLLRFLYNGDQFESKILIDALTAGSEAYLICNGRPLNDGKLSTYDRAIEEVLGSSELFFNSVFSGQKSKGIAELKPADRRKLFYELLNLLRYDSLLENSKARLKSEEMNLSKIEGEIKAIQDNQTSAEALEEKRVKLLNGQAAVISKISRFESEIETLEKEISELNTKIKLAEERKIRNSEYESKIKQMEVDIENLKHSHNLKIIRLQSENDDYKKLLERNRKLATPEAKQKIEDKLKNIQALRISLNNDKDNLTKVQKKYSDHQKQLAEELKSLGELEKKVNNLQSEINGLHKDSEQKRNELFRIDSSAALINKVPCDEPTGSKCQFLGNAYSDKNRIPELKEQIDEIESKIDFRTTELNEAEDKLRTEKHNIDEKFNKSDKELKAEINAIESSIKVKSSELEELQKDNWEKLNEELKEANHQILIYEEKIKNTKMLIDESIDNFYKSVDSLKAQSDDLFSKVDKNVNMEIRSLEQTRDIKANELSGSKNQLKALQSENSDIDKQIAAVDKDIYIRLQNQEKLQLLSNSKIKIESEIRDWTFLTKAFDKTGIPVLKLENSGIEITTIANELLSIFENNFRIVFETTKLKADKKSYKESFDINIVEDDGVCEISNKSGGQQVWLETAIQLAISLVVRNQGRNIQTAFLDEKDGALDLDNAYKYIDMLKKAHEMSGVHNTFIITHRPELLDFIPQQVKLSDGYLEIINN